MPKFIADSIEYCKNEEGYGLLRAMDYCDEYNDTGEWLERPENQETFACAWLFGYEVELEKLYTVEIPDPNSYCDYRYLSRNDNGICLDASNDTKWKQKKRNQFT
ncbi:DUF1642 domain-containing protein, partial [Streptococcus suis]|uniref:DUF1642 domain-containing protein n=1 Tax=Streptococcus suis TaxID=1307 RepID=UPI001EE6AB3D